MFNFKFYKSAMRSLIRNRWLAFATITVMTLTLTTISVFLLANYFIENSIVNLKYKIDLEAYFNNDVAESDIMEVKRELTKMPEVRDVTYISKEDALDIFKESRKDDLEISKIIEENGNSLPASLKINLNSSEDLEKVNSVFNGGKYDSLVYRTSYKNNKPVADWLKKMSEYLHIIGWALIGILGIISFIVILNTIRMTIYSRREEVEIMRLVGATNWYIRWPFVLEGAFYGFISIIVSSLIIYLFFTYAAIPYIVNNPFFQDVSKGYISYVSVRTPLILAYQLGTSILVGSLSSLAALGRYLKV